MLISHRNQPFDVCLLTKCSSLSKIQNGTMSVQPQNGFSFIQFQSFSIPFTLRFHDPHYYLIANSLFASNCSPFYFLQTIPPDQELLVYYGSSFDLFLGIPCGPVIQEQRTKISTGTIRHNVKGKGVLMMIDGVVEGCKRGGQRCELPTGRGAFRDDTNG